MWLGGEEIKSRRRGGKTREKDKKQRKEEGGEDKRNIIRELGREGKERQKGTWVG